MKDVVLDLLFPFALGNFVKREYVDVYSLVHADVLERLLVEFRTVHSYFHKEERYMRVCLRSLYKVLIPQFFWCHFHETLIVGSWHTHIHVIVPRQNLSPEVSAYGGPSCYEISDAVLLADTFYFGKNLVKGSLKLFQFLGRIAVIHNS